MKDLCLIGLMLLSTFVVSLLYRIYEHGKIRDFNKSWRKEE